MKKIEANLFVTIVKNAKALLEVQQTSNPTADDITAYCGLKALYTLVQKSGYEHNLAAWIKEYYPDDYDNVVTYIRKQEGQDWDLNTAFPYAYFNGLPDAVAHKA